MRPEDTMLEVGSHAVDPRTANTEPYLRRAAGAGILHATHGVRRAPARAGAPGRMRAMARTFLVPYLCASLSAGCLPLVTEGRRYMGDWDTSGLGVTVPIALKTSSGSSDSARSGRLEESLFLELSGWQQGGLIVMYEGETLDWHWDDIVWGEEHSCFDFREISVGIGKGWRRPWWGDDHNWLGRSARQVWWGGAVGLSHLRASLDNPTGLSYDDSTVGVYASVGFYNPFWGGLLLRYTFAPDVEMHGTDWGMSGLTVSYWWGWGGSAGVGAVNASPAFVRGARPMTRSP